MTSQLATITRKILTNFHIRLNKSLGQHFLTDQAALSRIVDSAELNKDDLVLEIGTGIGILTKELCEKAGFVISVEYDKKIIPAAKDFLKNNNNHEIIQDDFLKLDLPKLFDKHSKYRSIKVVANLPYYITSPIISKLIENKTYLKSMVFTLQKEVAERITSEADKKEYSSFSIFVNYHCTSEIVFFIAKSSFMPQPEVGSAVIKLVVRKEPKVIVKSEDLFFKIVHAAFIQRRKMLKNAIENANIIGIDKDKIRIAFEKLGLDTKRRGETLSIEEFARLSDSFISS